MENKINKVRDRLFEITVKVVILKDDKILLLKKAKDQIVHAEKYDLPGGEVEKCENITDGIKREIKEETNLKVKVGPVIDFCDFERDYYPDKEKKEKVHLHGKGLRFLAYYKEGEVKLCKEHEGFEWLSIDEAIAKMESQGFESYIKDVLVKAKVALELEKTLDGWKRCQADFENYKKRQAEARKELIQYGNINLITEILPVLDNFYASIEHIPAGEKDSPWVIGIMHIQKQLKKVLEDNNMTEIKIKAGDNFNPNIMEAIKQETVNSEQGTNDKGNKKECVVKKVLQKGYEIGEKVIRPARVIVE